MENTLHRVGYKTIRLAESFLSRSRRFLDRRASANGASTNGYQLERPNGTDEWEKVYAFEDIVAVDALRTPVASVIAELTKPGEILLEAGCGGGSISAELAVAGRHISLLDFSRPILDRSEKLFEISGLERPSTHLADLTKPLPLEDKSVDVVWSSGVLEHWTDDELIPIVKEMARVSRRAVISLVPNAGSVFYRWGKAVMEEQGRWPYGREIPRNSLRPIFEEAGLDVVQETALDAETSVAYLDQIDRKLQKQFSSWWKTLPEDDPVNRSLGYLLLTVGVPSAIEN